MADETIQVKITLLDEVSESVKAMRSNMEAQFAQTRAAADKTKNTFNELKTAILGVITIGAISAWAKSAAAAANEQAISQAKLAQALGFTSKALIAQADALKYKTLYDDDDIIAADVMLANYIKNEDQIQKLIPAVMDLATAQGLDLATASKMVARGFADDTEELGRFKIAVEGSAGSSQRLDSIVAGLTGTFGGQAAAAYAASNGTDTFAKAADDFNKGAGAVLNSNIVALAKGLNSAGISFGTLGKIIGEILMPAHSLATAFMGIDLTLARIKLGLTQLKFPSKQVQEDIAEQKKWIDTYEMNIKKFVDVNILGKEDLAKSFAEQQKGGGGGGGGGNRPAPKTSGGGGTNSMYSSYMEANANLPGGSEWVKKEYEKKKKFFDKQTEDIAKFEKDQQLVFFKGEQAKTKIQQEETDKRIAKSREEVMAYVQFSMAMGAAIASGVGKGQEGFKIALKNTLVTMVAFMEKQLVLAQIEGAILAFSTGNFAPMIGIGIETAIFEGVKNGIQSFRSGGDPRPGFAMVGEQGPELVRFNSGAHVYNNRQTRDIINNQGITVNIHDASGNLAETIRGQLRSGQADALVSDLRRKVAA